MKLDYQSTEDKNSPEYLAKKVQAGRNTIFMVLILSVINVIMMALDQGTYFLFSASVPYYLTVFGKGMDNGFVSGAWPEVGTYTITALVISAVILSLYLLCGLKSKKNTGWLAVAAGLFTLDTVLLVVISLLLLEEPMLNIMDMLFHVVVVAELFIAVRDAKKLKQLPNASFVEEERELEKQGPDLD